jgi:hypothetical protein
LLAGKVLPDYKTLADYLATSPSCTIMLSVLKTTPTTETAVVDAKRLKVREERMDAGVSDDEEFWHALRGVLRLVCPTTRCRNRYPLSS